MTTSDAMTGLTVTGESTRWVDGKQEPWTLYKWTCARCGGEGRNTFIKPIGTRMLEKRICHSCDYWEQFERKLEREHTSMTIIDGHVYSPGNRTSGEFRGMAGRRFDIEYIEPSVHAGKRITTFDLWSGGTMLESLAAKYPDTARFLGGAERAQASGMTCWNPSNHRSEPYPLPKTLGID
jgi:hypothetical protein